MALMGFLAFLLAEYLQLSGIFAVSDSNDSKWSIISCVSERGPVLPQQARCARAPCIVEGSVHGGAGRGGEALCSALCWAERRAQQALLGYVSACGLLFVQKEPASRLSPHPHDALP